MTKNAADFVSAKLLFQQNLIVSSRGIPTGSAVFKRPEHPVRSEAQHRIWFLPDTALGFFCALIGRSESRN